MINGAEVKDEWRSAPIVDIGSIGFAIYTPAVPRRDCRLLLQALTTE
jgi:hypothetical protein